MSKLAPRSSSTSRVGTTHIAATQRSVTCHPSTTKGECLLPRAATENSQLSTEAGQVQLSSFLTSPSLTVFFFYAVFRGLFNPAFLFTSPARAAIASVATSPAVRRIRGGMHG